MVDTEVGNHEVGQRTDDESNNGHGQDGNNSEKVFQHKSEECYSSLQGFYEFVFKSMHCRLLESMPDFRLSPAKIIAITLSQFLELNDTKRLKANA